MTTPDLIHTLRQGTPVNANLMREILARLEYVAEIEASMRRMAGVCPPKPKKEEEE